MGRVGDALDPPLQGSVWGGRGVPRASPWALVVPPRWGWVMRIQIPGFVTSPGIVAGTPQSARLAFIPPIAAASTLPPLMPV
jgi:hypothetical protein